MSPAPRRPGPCSACLPRVLGCWRRWPGVRGRQVLQPTTPTVITETGQGSRRQDQRKIFLQKAERCLGHGCSVRRWAVDAPCQHAAEITDASSRDCPPALALGSRGPGEGERPVIEAGARCVRAARWEPLRHLPCPPDHETRRLGVVRRGDPSSGELAICTGGKGLVRGACRSDRRPRHTQAPQGLPANTRSK